jgi:hypothetical protein
VSSIQARTCWIYRSSRKDGLYLYLGEEDNFEVVPKALFQRFGTPSLVMQLELDPTRRLAREDSVKVLQNLQDQGFHLQLPPDLKPHLYEGE